MLAVAHHRGLDHLPERALLGGGDKEASQLVDSHRGSGPASSSSLPSPSAVSGSSASSTAPAAALETQREHGQARAEQVGEVVQQDQAVP